MTFYGTTPHRWLLRLLPYVLFLVMITLLGLGTLTTAQERTEKEGGEAPDEAAGSALTAEIALAIDDQGRVGIGTANPTVLLTLGPDPMPTTNSSHLFQVAKSGDAFMTVEDGMATALLGVTAGVPFVGSLSDDDFIIRSGNKERIRITKEGKVGIGTTTPSFALNVDPKGSGGILIGNSSTGSGQHTSLIMSISAESDGYAEIQAIKSSGTPGGLGDIALNPVGGRVGIGTASPKFKLHVVAPGKAGDTGLGVLVQSAAEFGTAFVLRNTSANGGDWHLISGGSGNEGGPGRFTLAGGTDGSVKILVDPAGNVGIGTNNPAATLHVKGSLRTDTLFIGSPFNANKKNMQWDNVTGEVGYDNSSRRYKENIVTFKDDFYKILLAEPRTYTRPRDPDVWEIGYIAEEFADAGLTSLVGYDQEGLPDYIHYDRIGLYLTEIVKDQQLRIEALEHENEALRADLESKVGVLLKRLDALEARLPRTGS